MATRDSKTTRKTTRKHSAKRSLNVLFTSVGRRVELVRAFRSAAKKLGIGLTVHGADMTCFAPAMHHVDKAHIVPAIKEAEHLDALLEIVRKHRIDMAIPLIDIELMSLSKAYVRFDALGCRAVISGENVINTCQDKIQTYHMLRRAEIDTPATWTYEQAIERKRLKFPLFMKPREGSAGMGNYVVHDRDDLRVLARRVPNPIVQELVVGVEHTLDVYTGFDGIPRCIVPRRRIEVRNGEVSKGVIVKDRRIIVIGKQVATALADCRGVVTVQCIVTADKRIRVIEINPRFGGGAPLAIHAGADFPLWLMAEHLGRPVPIKPTAFDNHLAMLRFDESVFYKADRRQW